MIFPLWAYLFLLEIKISMYIVDAELCCKQNERNIELHNWLSELEFFKHAAHNYINQQHRESTERKNDKYFTEKYVFFEWLVTGWPNKKTNTFKTFVYRYLCFQSGATWN